MLHPELGVKLEGRERTNVSGLEEVFKITPMGVLFESISSISIMLVSSLIS